MKMKRLLTMMLVLTIVATVFTAVFTVPVSAAWTGRVQGTSPAISYTDFAQDTNNPTTYFSWDPGTKGATISYTFTGTGIRLYNLDDPGWGYTNAAFDVYIDTVKYNASMIPELSSPAGDSGTKIRYEIPAGTLTNAQHTIEIRFVLPNASSGAFYCAGFEHFEEPVGGSDPSTATISVDFVPHYGTPVPVTTIYGSAGASTPPGNAAFNSGSWQATGFALNAGNATFANTGNGAINSTGSYWPANFELNHTYTFTINTTTTYNQTGATHSLGIKTGYGTAVTITPALPQNTTNNATGTFAGDGTAFAFRYNVTGPGRGNGGITVNSITVTDSYNAAPLLDPEGTVTPNGGSAVPKTGTVLNYDLPAGTRTLTIVPDPGNVAMVNVDGAGFQRLVGNTLVIDFDDNPVANRTVLIDFVPAPPVQNIDLDIGLYVGYHIGGTFDYTYYGGVDTAQVTGDKNIQYNPSLDGNEEGIEIEALPWPGWELDYVQLYDLSWTPYRADPYTANKANVPLFIEDSFEGIYTDEGGWVAPIFKQNAVNVNVDVNNDAYGSASRNSADVTNGSFMVNVPWPASSAVGATIVFTAEEGYELTGLTINGTPVMSSLASDGNGGGTLALSVAAVPNADNNRNYYPEQNIVATFSEEIVGVGIIIDNPNCGHSDVNTYTVYGILKGPWDTFGFEITTEEQVGGADPNGLTNGTYDSIGKEDLETVWPGLTNFTKGKFGLNILPAEVITGVDFWLHLFATDDEPTPNYYHTLWEFMTWVKYD